MRRTEAPEALPGACFKCNSSNRDFYVDLEMSVEFIGVLYLCNECIAEVTRVCPVETGLLEDKAELQVALAVTQSHLNRYKEAVNGLFSTRAWADLDSFAGPDATEPVVADESVEDELRRVKAGKQGPVEPSNDEQLDRVSADDAFKLKLG